MKRQHIWKAVCWAMLIMPLLSACKKFLNVVPDNVATIENAFTMRKEAEKYLFTCYSYLPSSASVSANPAYAAGDEISYIWPFAASAAQPGGYNIARGLQNVTSPYVNYWDGLSGGKKLYNGLRDCNTFLDNISKVPDMTADEKRRWIAEVKFLKAYYHFYLVRLYGPIVLIKENLPIDVNSEQVRVYRQPVDSCFQYITQLIDEAKDDLPNIISNEIDELGRVTKPVALAIKARILVTAASPLFNGNPDYSSYADNRGVKLFSATKDDKKWADAVKACKEAVDLCHEVGLKLYTFKPDVVQFQLAPETITQMSIRNAFIEKWTPEVIWANTNSMTSEMQNLSFPRGLDQAQANSTAPRGQLAPPLKIVEMFYTKNGLPISEDKTWDYGKRYTLRTATAAEKFNIEENYTTVSLHFDRENRFYASIGFDGGKWYGQNYNDDKTCMTLKMKKGQSSSQQVQFSYSTTGYFTKKLLHFQSIVSSNSAVSIRNTPFPEMRLADLYLLYAEALNETEGPTGETLKWINLVRERAGIPSVQDAWTTYSKTPGAFQGKDGMRKIIHQERLIELAFEGSRFYDVRRWKEATELWNQPITGWDIEQSTAEAYYRVRPIFQQTFALKDYFWPLREQSITVNRNLVQSPGWQ
ncbi:RagB/SusD family nutrient uptake outer membrane protein [Chitinophaga lutea]|uniref:RagB/SusD family nutrient uptake outer membrane protein n=1 Tax=Chitinophaga lutea TaxID=2488634 RepID=A0A3N4Q2G3_9BACT|nr:RagB/SusD family nutrient uptake outer membrane protein [Chitinophaga lutea]RPE14418.1 RagB/SusD family nutrient uptake outer membrane protein [Chitinophaga lutea]